MFARRISSLFLIFYLAVIPSVNATDNTSGLPVPRFVALKSEEVNVRSGPGTRYPISWVYRRDGLPVEVIEEFDFWRKVRDVEGSAGWVHKSMLDGRRNVVIKSKEARVVRTAPEPSAKPMLKAEPMVIAKLVECEKDWCKVQLSGRKGWIERKYLWGVYADEKLQ